MDNTTLITEAQKFARDIKFFPETYNTADENILKEREFCFIAGFKKAEELLKNEN